MFWFPPNVTYSFYHWTYLILQLFYCVVYNTGVSGEMMTTAGRGVREGNRGGRLKLLISELLPEPQSQFLTRSFSLDFCPSHNQRFCPSHEQSWRERRQRGERLRHECGAREERRRETKTSGGNQPPSRAQHLTK